MDFSYFFEVLWQDGNIMRIMSDYEKTSVEKVNFVGKIFAFRITTSFFALFLLLLWSLKRHHLPKLPSLHSAFYSCNELGRFFSPTHFYLNALHLRLHWRLPWDQQQSVSCIKVLFRSGDARTRKKKKKSNPDENYSRFHPIFSLQCCQCDQSRLPVVKLQKIYFWKDSKPP